MTLTTFMNDINKKINDINDLSGIMITRESIPVGYVPTAP